MRPVIARGLFGKDAYLIRGDIVANVGDVLNHMAAECSGSVLYKATASFFADNPVIDVRFNQEVVSKLFPEGKVHGTPLSLP